MQSAVAVTLMPLLIFFAANTAAVIQNALKMPHNSKNCPFPLRDLDPIQIVLLVARRECAMTFFLFVPKETVFLLRLVVIPKKYCESAN